MASPLPTPALPPARPAAGLGAGHGGLVVAAAADPFQMWLPEPRAASSRGPAGSRPAAAEAAGAETKQRLPGSCIAAGLFTAAALLAALQLRSSPAPACLRSASARPSPGPAPPCTAPASPLPVPTVLGTLETLGRVLPALRLPCSAVSPPGAMRGLRPRSRCSWMMHGSAWLHIPALPTHPGGHRDTAELPDPVPAELPMAVPVLPLHSHRERGCGAEGGHGAPAAQASPWMRTNDVSAGTMFKIEPGACFATHGWELGAGAAAVPSASDGSGPPAHTCAHARGMPGADPGRLHTRAHVSTSSSHASSSRHFPVLLHRAGFMGGQ